MQSNTKYMTVDEVAEYIRASQRHIRRLISENKIPHYQPEPGGKILLIRSEVDAYVQSLNENTASA
jgi:excisionase family DNA binding protein